MPLARAQQAIASAAVTLVLWILCIAAFLPPLLDHTLKSLFYIIGAGMGIFVFWVLHLIFIGIAARRLGRSAWVWVIIAMVGMPLASIIGLILFEWFSEEEKQATA